jgi:hypothetical protein
LADVDPQFEMIEKGLLDPGVVEVFQQDAAEWDPPAVWGMHGLWTCENRDQMVRALYWWLPKIPKCWAEDLRRYGFSTEDPRHPTNPHFREENREALLTMLPVWNKFTVPVPQTLEAWVFG